MVTPKNTLSIDLDEDAIHASGTTLTGTVIDEDRPLPLGSAGNDADVVDEDAEDPDKLPKQAVQNSDGSVTLPLAFPVTLRTRKDGKVSEKTFNELTFHRLNGADQRAIASTSENSMNVTAIARSTRVNQAVMNALFDRMDAFDIASGARVIAHFLSNGPTTGK